MKTSERLQRRIRKELGIDIELPKRLYHGHHQRSAGAWSWCARRKTGAGLVGSQFNMSELVRADGLYADIGGDTDIEPVEGRS